MLTAVLKFNHIGFYPKMNYYYYYFQRVETEQLFGAKRRKYLYLLVLRLHTRLYLYSCPLGLIMFRLSLLHEHLRLYVNMSRT